MVNFDFDDIRLIPKLGVLQSRSEADTSATLGDHTFKIPAVPANMSTIIDTELAEYLASNGYFYVMHRFDIDPIDFTEEFHSKNLIASISLGIKEVDRENTIRLAKLKKAPEYITIDVAHGHAIEVLKMVKFVKDNLPESFLIAGNIATVEAANDLIDAGADAVKVGIGPGMACTTAPNTGFGTQGLQLSTVFEIAENVDIPVIADGGIRHYGDIAKAVAFGAKMVMIGGMFGGHDENPGEVIEEENGEKFKVFFGSASEHQKGEKKHVEGRKLMIPYKGSISETLRTIEENLQSSISYAGGRQLEDLLSVEYNILGDLR